MLCNDSRKELEELILSCMLVFDEEPVKFVIDEQSINDPDFFMYDLHKEIFRIMLYLYKCNIKIDPISIINNRYSSLSGVQAPLFSEDISYGMTLIMAKAVSTAHLELYVKVLQEHILKDYWRKNISIKIAETQWENTDVFDISDEIIQGYSNLEESFTGTSSLSNSSIESVKRKWEKNDSGEHVIVPFPSADMNRHMAGLNPPELTILAARPSMGKSTLALIFVIYMSLRGSSKCLFVSLEMSKEQLINKIVSVFIGVDYSDIRSMRLSAENRVRYFRAYEELDKHGNLSIYTQDTVDSLSALEKVIKLEKPDYVVLDYIQLMRGESKLTIRNREQEVSNISRTLKLFASKYNIPILALSQLNREVEKRTNKRPMLSDLRESGSLEQDADNVIMIYRDAYYRSLSNTEIVHDFEFGNTELLLVKGRDVGTAVFHVHMDIKKMTLSDGFAQEFMMIPD